MENPMTHQMKIVSTRIRHFWDENNRNDMMKLNKLECERCGHTHEVKADTGQVVLSKALVSDEEIAPYIYCR